jgi:hypothetical protein
MMSMGALRHYMQELSAAGRDSRASTRAWADLGQRLHARPAALVRFGSSKKPWKAATPSSERQREYPRRSKASIGCTKGDVALYERKAR